jgi:hypothetical protein
MVLRLSTTSVRRDSRMQVIDLQGHAFGRLTVVARAENYPGGKARWRVQCSCGQSKVVAAESLRKGRTTSCGCQMTREKHGHANKDQYSATYHSWRGMKARCSCPKVNGYRRYGGRGIRVCARWEKFENFLADMGVRPAGMTLERRDNDGDYTPRNCCWATPEQQRANKTQRTVRKVTA